MTVPISHLFSGRLNRSGFLLRVVMLSLTLPVFVGFLRGLASKATFSHRPSGVDAVGVLVLVISAGIYGGLYYSFLVRRAHDFGQSYVYALIGLFPLGVLIFALRPGHRSANGFAVLP
jgi:uncharacterized membrane protein YhaH (DUF805 family)